MIGKASAIAEVASSKGKGPAIAAGTAIAGPSPFPNVSTIVDTVLPTKDPPSIDDGEVDIFAIAKKMHELLEGLSIKSTSKVLNMVGSLKGLRTIPVDRPIGPVMQVKPGSGIPGSVVTTARGGSVNRQSPTPKAAWKQSDDYRRLSVEHQALIRELKSVPNGPDKDSQRCALVSLVRLNEQSLRNLKQVPSAGES